MGVGIPRILLLFNFFVRRYILNLRMRQDSSNRAPQLFARLFTCTLFIASVGPVRIEEMKVLLIVLL